MLCRNHVDVAEGVRRCARCGAPFCSDCLVEISGRPYCATCKSEQLLDVRSGVDRSQLQLSSIGRRFGAVFLDSLLVVIPMYAILAFVVILPATRGQQPSPIMNFIGLPFALFSLVYEGLMLQFKDGQTLGKMALKGPRRHAHDPRLSMDRRLHPRVFHAGQDDAARHGGRHARHRYLVNDDRHGL
jgi:hypothetical protein